jgi:hypothetical protein
VGQRRITACVSWHEFYPPAPAYIAAIMIGLLVALASGSAIAQGFFIH